MKVTFLGGRDFEDQSKNYGDCILIDDGTNLIIYDCGSEELAEKAIEYMDKQGYAKADIILSHNDRDHYKGIERLKAKGKISSVTTLLLFKYADEILKILDDDRRTKAGVISKTKEDFDNIASLSGCNLKDALSDDCYLSKLIKIVGPDKEFVLKAVAKQINESESDEINSETITNAISIQVEVDIDGKKLLLTGDASIDSFDDKVREYDCVQLPHHGKKEHAEKIIEFTKDKPDVHYYISDNTGNTNGGSDRLEELDLRGLLIYNTKKDGDFIIDYTSFDRNIRGTLGQ